MLRLVRLSAVPPFMSGVVRTGLANVPTLVNDDVTTVAAKEVPLMAVPGMVQFVSVPEAGVPSAAPERITWTPSTVIAPAALLASVVSVA